jgi:hypothetical protein
MQIMLVISKAYVRFKIPQTRIYLQLFDVLKSFYIVKIHQVDDVP